VSRITAFHVRAWNDLLASAALTAEDAQVSADARDLVIDVAPRRKGRFAKAAIALEGGLILERWHWRGRIRGVAVRSRRLRGGERRMRRKNYDCNKSVFHACPCR